MKNFRRILVGAALAVMTCGLASAGSIVQTFSAPTGSNALNWSSLTDINSYSYYENLFPTLDGNLTDVIVSLTWTSNSTGAATDNNSSSTGGDSYTWQANTTVNLETGNSLFLFGASGITGICKDSSFTNKSFGQSFTEAGCPDGSTIENGGPYSNTYTSGARYSYFLGSGGAPNTVALTASASLLAAFAGPAYINGSANGVANESVTIEYDYTAPPTGTPEPATLFLMGSALVGVGLLRKRIKS